MSDGSLDFEAHPLSASKMKTYGRCPALFGHKYVDRRDPIGQDRHYLDIGDAVHYSLEEMLAEHVAEEGADRRLTRSQSELWTDALSTLSNVLAGEMAYADVDPRSEFPIELDDDQRETVKDCLGAATRWLADRQPRIRGVEAEADYRIDRPDIDVPVTGYMDLATGGDGDPNEVVDWKTGKSQGKGTDETLQGATYMAGYYNLYGEPPEAIHFVYLKEGKVRTLDPDDELWQHLLSKARQLVAAVDAGEFPAQPDPSKCHFCEFEMYCDASPVGAGGIAWDTYPSYK